MVMKLDLGLMLEFESLFSQHAGEDDPWVYHVSVVMIASAVQAEALAER
jgi:hypothetical protein